MKIPLETIPDSTFAYYRSGKDLYVVHCLDEMTGSFGGLWKVSTPRDAEEIVRHFRNSHPLYDTPCYRNYWNNLLARLSALVGPTPKPLAASQPASAGTTYTTAYRTARELRMGGSDRLANPHAAGTPAHKGWEDGLYDGGVARASSAGCQ